MKSDVDQENLTSEMRRTGDPPPQKSESTPSTTTEERETTVIPVTTISASPQGEIGTLPDMVYTPRGLEKKPTNTGELRTPKTVDDHSEVSKSDGGISSQESVLPDDLFNFPTKRGSETTKKMI